MLEPGAPALSLLQRAGEPACRARLDGGERWVYARSGTAGSSCAPSMGDLVVIVRENQVVSFTPEHGRSDEVRGPQDMADFRSRYSVRR